MKKTILSLLSIFFVSVIFSQVSVSAKHEGSLKKINSETYNRFKSTTTIFVLSNLYNKEIYEKILNDSWTITPFKLVEASEFKIDNYLDDKYSFAILNGLDVHVQRSSVKSNYLYFNIDLLMYKNDKLKPRLRKLRSKKKVKKEDINFTLNKYSINIARFNLFPKDSFCMSVIKGKVEDNEKALYNDDVFQNYKPGYLKNYFQKVNNILEKKENYWMYGSDNTQEIKLLPEKKLIIPEYISIKFNPFDGTNKGVDLKRLNDMLKDYEYDYEIKNSDDISTMIMDGDEFYYLRYVRLNTERFIQIINSKTGEIIYRDYITGMSYNLKSKNFKRLVKTIKKVLKN